MYYCDDGMDIKKIIYIEHLLTENVCMKILAGFFPQDVCQ